MDNGDFVQRIIDGDKDSFEAFVLQNEKNIYNLCLRMSGNEEDAFDLTQEAFVKAFRSMSGFKKDSALSTWLYRIASNTCIDFLRRKKKRFSISFDIDEEEETQIQLPDNRYNPEIVFERNEIKEEVSKALTQLSPQFRQIVVLRDINGLSYHEIAEVLELEEGTVKSRLSRAREQLRRALGNIIAGAASK